MVRKHCTVCMGKGKIPNPKEDLYMKEIDCPNCDGEGFVGFPENWKKIQEGTKQGEDDDNK